MNEVSANHLGSEAQIFGADALTIFGFAFKLNSNYWKLYKRSHDKEKK